MNYVRVFVGIFRSGIGTMDQENCRVAPQSEFPRSKGAIVKGYGRTRLNVDGRSLPCTTYIFPVYDELIVAVQFKARSGVGFP